MCRALTDRILRISAPESVSIEELKNVDLPDGVMVSVFES